MIAFTHIGPDPLGAEEPFVAAVLHRIEHLEVGDIAFVVAVSSEHRKAAFETTMNLVDEVKARLPVWKRQIFAAGHDEWVGSA